MQAYSTVVLMLMAASNMCKAGRVLFSDATVLKMLKLLGILGFCVF